METTLNNKEFKLREIHLAISQLAAGNYHHRAEQTGDGEESDAVMLGLNMLAEELEAQQLDKENTAKQIQEKEESLRMMFHAIDDDLALIDFEANSITTCNKQFEARVKRIDERYTKEYLKSIDFDQVLERLIEQLSEDKSEILELVDRSRNEGVSGSIVLTPEIDGKPRSFELSLHPVELSEGSRILWRCKDLTEHRLAMEQLKVSETNLKKAEQVSHIGHWTFNVQTGEIVWSDELCRIFGIEVGNHPDFEGYVAMLHPDDRQMVTGVIQKCMAEVGTYNVVHRILTPENEVRYLECRGGCVVDDDGQLVKMLGTSYDISEKELLNQKARASEARMQEAQTMAKMGNWVWYAAEGRSEWSEALYDIYELNSEEEVPPLEEYTQMIHPDDLDKFTEFMSELTKSSSPKEHSFRIITAAGNLKYLRAIAHCQSAEPNLILAGTTQDITAIREAQDKIQESEERLELALNASNTGIFEYRFEDKDLYWDEIAKNIYGYSDEEEKSPYEFMLYASDESDRQRIKHTFEDLEGVMRRGNYSDSYIIEVQGSDKHITTTAVILRDGSGKPQRMVGTIRDISLQVIHDRLIRDMNTQLERTNRNLKLTNTHLEEIAHVSSHDLKAPLLNLSALFKLIDQDSLDDKNSLIFEKANHSVMQMRETLNVISKVIELQYGKELPIEDLDLEEVMKDVLNQIAHQIEESRAQITTDFTKLRQLSYPRFHLTSILMNLVTNAIKYKKIDEEVKITLETKLESNRPVLEISDNGLGINLDLHRGKMFRLFKRFHDHVPGKGVGLHIVHSIVNSHGGNIEVYSEVNKGTTFKLTLSNE